jgi:hypothetical protein
MRLALLVALAGCLEHVELAGDSLPGLEAIEVSPAQQTLAIVLPSSPQTVAYTALGHFADGSTRDITAELAWTTDNPAPGAFITPGTYTSSNAAGGHIAIRAAHDTVAATAALTVIISAQLVDDGFPPPASGLFDPGTPTASDAMKSPVIAYPADATRFPQGLAPVVFQYQHGMMTDAYRLAFESDVLDLTVLTGSDRWRPDEDTWALIERSHPDATATFEVDAASSVGPGTIWTGVPETLAFSATDPGGVIYYGAKMKQGVLRALLGSPTAAKLYPPPGDATPTENAAVSRDGVTMALAYGGHMRVYDIATATATAATSSPMGWAAVSPDGKLVVVANMGMLALRDAQTGQGVGSPDGHFDVGGMATHPDWSPDGTAIVIALGTMVSNDDLKGGAIARVPYAGNGAWGAPQIIVPSSGDTDNSYFPKWSPDGNYIAFVHATEAAKGATSAELRLVPAAGGTPTVLARASHQLALGPDAMAGDAMPAWSPDGAWLVFTSLRPYGVVRPMAGPPQLWMSAIDPAAPGDPSQSALWLPAQDITAPNVAPSWAPAITTTDLSD